MQVESGMPSPEPQLRSLPRLLGLDLAVARRRMGMQRGQQLSRRGGYFGDGKVERRLIGLRRPAEAGEFSHELQRRGADFILGRRWLEIEQRLDVPDHRSSPLPFSAHFGIEWPPRSPPRFAPTSEFPPMSHVTYKIVQHDGGWAYTVDGVLPEPFPPHATALPAARHAAAEQRVPGRTEAIEYETADGKWHTETAAGSDRPDTDVEGKA